LLAARTNDRVRHLKIPISERPESCHSGLAMTNYFFGSGWMLGTNAKKPAVDEAGGTKRTHQTSPVPLSPLGFEDEQDDCRDEPLVAAALRLRGESVSLRELLHCSELSTPSTHAPADGPRVHAGSLLFDQTV